MLSKFRTDGRNNMAVLEKKTSLRENRELYRKDYYSWALKTADLVRQGRFAEIDPEVLGEEIEDMGKSEKREFTNLLSQSFSHLIKVAYLLEKYPDNKNRWRKDAEIFLEDAMDTLRENPGLKGELPKIVEDSWKRARGLVFQAFDDFTKRGDLDRAGIPAACPWAPEAVLAGNILPQDPEGGSKIRVSGLG